MPAAPTGTATRQKGGNTGDGTLPALIVLVVGEQDGELRGGGWPVLPYGTYFQYQIDAMQAFPTDNYVYLIRQDHERNQEEQCRQW